MTDKRMIENGINSKACQPYLLKKPGKIPFM
jgi:hypothetical protein